ncbi:MAG TPA: MFS transporter [Longimicrobiaceae bacterium]|nr:MFS transporter [Longimicrobiaceae bacterium]
MIGLGGLFVGVTGPLLSAFIPPLVRDALGDHRIAIGAVMALDNVLLIVLVPWAGPASDRARSRMPLVLTGLLLASAGMALLPASAGLGLPVLIAALVLLYAGINLQRSPFQALLADAVPSPDRPLATASVTFQMCVGAIAFLMLGRALGMRTSFLVAAATILGIAAVLRLGVHETASSQAADAEISFRSIAQATWAALRGSASGMRAIFAATLLLQLTFQSFTTWYALHATERFGIRPEDATIGFIAWAVGGVIGALPAGFLGVRLGRRNTILAGFALLAACLLGLDRVTSLGRAVPLLALASAAWTLPTVNAYPLFVELVPRRLRGALASLYLLCIALGGAIGDPLNGALFDAVGSYRPLFLMMAVYTGAGFLAMALVPRGSGEAGSGAEAAAEPA